MWHLSSSSPPIRACGRTPPGGGCDINDVSGEVTSSYVNGALVGTDSDWSAKVLCTTTAPGQSMAGISIDSTLWLNSFPIADGNQWNCVNCNLGNSTGTYLCAGTANCAGTYWVGSLPTLTLPAGWVWVTPVPSNCILLSPESMTCSVVTNTIVVPPAD
jgi:hypothetical protein